MGWTKRSAAVSLLLAMERHRLEAGQRVRALRDARGWSQADLAYQAKLSIKTISRFENGHHDGRRGTVRALAEALNVTEVDILGPPPDVLGLKSVATDEQLEGVDGKFSELVAQVQEQLDRIEREAQENSALLRKLMHLVDEGLFTPRPPREAGGQRSDQVPLGAALTAAFEANPAALEALQEQLQRTRSPARTRRAPAKRAAS